MISFHFLLIIVVKLIAYISAYMMFQYFNVLMSVIIHCYNEGIGMSFWTTDPDPIKNEMKVYNQRKLVESILTNKRMLLIYVVSLIEALLLTLIASKYLS